MFGHLAIDTMAALRSALFKKDRVGYILGLETFWWQWRDLQMGTTLHITIFPLVVVFSQI